MAERNTKSNYLYFIIGFLVLLIVSIVGFGVIRGRQGNDNFVVSASIFPIYDITRNIMNGAEGVEVNLILPVGATPHGFTYSASDQSRIENSDLVFSVGHELDGWIVDMVGDRDKDVMQLDSGIDLIKYADLEDGHDESKDSGQDKHDEKEHNEEIDEQGHNEVDQHNKEVEKEEHSKEDGHTEEEGSHDKHDHGEYDPHYWLSLENGIQIAENIAEKLIEVNVDNKSIYENNLSDYKKALDDALSSNQEKMANLSKNEIITFHDAFNYLAREYNVDIVATIEESPGETPTAEYISEVGETIEKYDVRVLFKEPQLSEEIIQPLADDYNATVSNMDPLGGGEETESYINLISFNINNLSQALK